MHFQNKLKVQEVLKAKAQQRQKGALFSSVARQTGRRTAQSHSYSRLGSSPPQPAANLPLGTGAKLCQRFPLGTGFFFHLQLAKPPSRAPEVVWVVPEPGCTPRPPIPARTGFARHHRHLTNRARFVRYKRLFDHVHLCQVFSKWSERQKGAACWSRAKRGITLPMLIRIIE